MWIILYYMFCSWKRLQLGFKHRGVVVTSNILSLTYLIRAWKDYVLGKYRPVCTDTRVKNTQKLKYCLNFFNLLKVKK